LKSTIFIGSVYYQRLKQMVADKVNSRSTGPNKLLTRQPNGGRANDGGLRIGEMERDSLLSHGISAFIQESMMARSDGYETIFNPKTGRMDIMKNEETPMDISMPYSMKLLIQELESMGLETRVLAEGI
jgi:DNA-directed RNA polymerase beta subunit